MKRGKQFPNKQPKLTDDSQKSKASRMRKMKTKSTVKKMKAEKRNTCGCWGTVKAKKLKAPRKQKRDEEETSSKYDGPRSMEIRLLTMVRGKPCARNRMPCDRRKMRRMRLFDPCRSRAKGQAGNEQMLERAKRKVLKELTRQQELGIYKPSPLEQAFLDATNESFLTIDYGWMKTLVRTARFSDPEETKRFSPTDDAYNDNVKIILNGKKKFIEADICTTLLHECLHNTVERAGKPGNPQLSEQIEHTAMALLGDRDEQQEYLQRYFNFDYMNESWLKVHQRKKRRRNSKYLKDVYIYL